MIAWPAKDPAEELDFSWTVPLDTGDSIATFTATKASGTVTKESQSNSTTIGTVWISGGTANEKAYFTLEAVTLGGRTFRESAILPIIDRAAELLGTFRMRYPAFASIDDGKISYWLADAGLVIGSNWPSDWILPAKACWTAHKLAESGALSGAVPAGLTSFKSGTFSATVSDSIAGLTGLDATVYGREFLAMRRSLFSGPIMSWNSPERSSV
jgi:hypothetical protein